MLIIKSTLRVFMVPATILLIFVAGILQPGAAAATGRSHASQVLQASLGMQGSNAAAQPAQKAIDQELDTLFAKTKTDFEKMALSPILKSPRLPMVNSFFIQSLKIHLPWQSLIRTDKKGQVIDEVIRIEGISKEKRSVADQTWFTQVSKTMKEHNEIAITEKTGRYYLVWAAPIVSKVKGADVFQGAVAVRIDLWDCFDRFADTWTSPFMIRILGRVTLYDHLWKDTIKYIEKPLAVPGLDKIAVRYPGMTTELAAARAADSAARELARLDSMRVKAAADSIIKVAQTKKAKARNTSVAAMGIIVFLIIVVGIILLVVYRRRVNAGNPAAKGRFDNL
jgi:hypothetical protein